MKKYLFVCFVLFANLLFAQKPITTSTGEIEFFSSTPVEDIKAVNKKVQSALNTSNNEIAFKAPIKDFIFPKALMQEHFNENYMETEKYPNATFAGKINEKVDFSKDGTYLVTATGKLNIHNVSQDRTVNGSLIIKNGKVSLDAAFDVALADHKIEIPTIVFKKIAEKIAIKVKLQYQ